MYRHEVCERYFREIRSYLKDKPTRFHLVDEDFAIDNTVVDSRLLGLRQKIVEVASQQPYWGEEVPARWLLLERDLMRLKAAGIKVIPRTLLEAFNQAEAIPIPTEELDLFLKFQNDIGTILYFSIEVLKDKIVLVPQWMIDALASLITAEMFVLRNAPAVAKKWDMFNKSGKLYPELIDAIWTKENKPDLHDNKEHILLLMEHLNIIARPRCFSEDPSEIKVENYFLAPCMLKEKTPEKVMFPKPDPEMKSSSSVLCYNFVGKFLPSPIFHRLLATCVSHWPIAQRKSENQIFCGCCIFRLDLHHRLTVLFREYVIFVHVTRMGTTEKTPSSKLCIEVQEFITKTLTSIIGYLGHSLKFEMSVQCPKSVGYRVDCLIPVADLQGNVDVPCDFHDDSHVIRSQDVLKFWFQEEEPSDAGCVPVAFVSDTAFIGETNMSASIRIPFISSPSITDLKFFKTWNNALIANDTDTQFYHTEANISTIFYNTGIVLQGMEAVLDFRSLKEPDFGQYTLVLYNNKGTASLIVHLKELAPLSPVEQFYFYKLVGQYMEFFFVPGFNGGHQQTFTIQFKPSGSLDESWKNTSINGLSEMDDRYRLPNGTFLVQVEKLQPGRYIFRMFSVNKKNIRMYSHEVPVYIEEDPHTDTNIGPSIAGIAGGIGGGVVVIVVTGVVIFLWRRHNNTKNSTDDTACVPTAEDYEALQAKKNEGSLYQELSDIKRCADTENSFRRNETDTTENQPTYINTKVTVCFPPEQENF